MIPTGLYGNYNLTNAAIDAHVSNSVGAYVLGDEIAADGSLTIRYVGRSDDDLNARLKNWVGSYKYFQYGHLSTKTDAYEKECRLYHTFGSTRGLLDNEIHPAKPYVSSNCPMKCGR